MRKAFTLVEVLIVLAILVVLAALLQPVFVRAVQNSRETRAIAQLTQLDRFFQLYRQEWAGGPGPASSVGLPDFLLLDRGPDQVLPRAAHPLFKSPCGDHPDTPKGVWNLGFLASDLPDEPWAERSQRLGEQALYLVDRNCNDPQVPLGVNYFPHQVLAMRLDGSLVSRRIQNFFAFLDEEVGSESRR